MKRTPAHELLALDSIYGFLKAPERLKLHLFIQGKTEVLDERTSKMMACIKEQKYHAPELRYGQDRLLYFYDEDKLNWRLVKYYKTEIITQITNL